MIAATILEQAGGWAAWLSLTGLVWLVWRDQRRADTARPAPQTPATSRGVGRGAAAHLHQQHSAPPSAGPRYGLPARPAVPRAAAPTFLACGHRAPAHAHHPAWQHIDVWCRTCHQWGSVA